jgi:hypothetical protein
METSSTIKNIAAALSAFQAEVGNVPKDGTNPFFKSKYATLENGITFVKPFLAKHDIAYAQFPQERGLYTVLMHTSGEWMGSWAALVIKDETPQGQGSAITYMRRYALFAALGIATEDDDDGNEASKPTQSRQAAPQRTKPTETRKDPAVELLAQKDRVVSLLKQLGFKPVGKTVAEKREEVADAVFQHASLMLSDTNLEAIAEILSAKIESLEAVGDQ